MRLLVKAFIILLLLNTVLFLIHYQDSSMVTTKNERENSYDQEIEVIHRSNEVLIHHHFTNLPTHRVELRWPRASVNRTCYIEEGTSCLRLNEEATAFKEGEETAQSISYSIPKEATAAEQVLMQDVFIELHQATPKATVLQVIDEVHENGLWVTGVQQVGNQTRNAVNYSLFSGQGPVSDLYWQSQRPVSQSTQYLTVHGRESLAEVEQYESLFKKLGPAHTTIVMNEQAQHIISPRFIVTTGPRLQETLQQFAVRQFRLQYDNVYVDHFTAEVLTALILEEEEVELSLASSAVEEMKHALSSLQISQLLEKVTKADEIADAKVVDEIIEEVSGYQTSFFSTNAQLDEGYYPFLLENPKKIVVSNGDPLSKHAIVQDNQSYYPITEVMEAFGYDVRKNDHSIYIESPQRNYRIPFKRDFYVLNDRRINIQERLVQPIDNAWYIEEAMMLRTFQLNKVSTEDEIKLNPITS